MSGNSDLETVGNQVGKHPPAPICENI